MAKKESMGKVWNEKEKLRYAQKEIKGDGSSRLRCFYRHSIGKSRTVEGTDPGVLFSGLGVGGAEKGVNPAEEIPKLSFKGRFWYIY